MCVAHVSTIYSNKARKPLIRPKAIGALRTSAELFLVEDGVAPELVPVPVVVAVLLSVETSTALETQWYVVEKILSWLFKLSK